MTPANESWILRWLGSFVRTPTPLDALEAAMSSYCELRVEQTSPIQASQDGNFKDFVSKDNLSIGVINIKAIAQ